MPRQYLLATIITLCAQDALAQGETPQQLADVFRDCACGPAGAAPELLTLEVANFSVFTDDDGVVVAFKSSLEARSFHVVASSGGTVQHAEFDARGLGANASDVAGPVISVERMDGMILVGISASFSDIATIVIDPALERVGTLHGTVLAVLPGGLALYQRTQDRFAATRYTELAVLDTHGGGERDIYPPAQPDPVRRERIERERADYAGKGADWCRDNKHHCEPERFDNAVWRSDRRVGYAYDADTQALALSVTYGSGEDAVDVMVVCEGMGTLESIACHETPLAAWTASLGNLERLDLIEAAAAAPHAVEP